MWSFVKNMLLRLLVNVCVFIWVVCLVLMAISMAFDYSQRMFWWSVVSFILYVIGGVVYFGSCDVAFHLAF